MLRRIAGRRHRQRFTGWEWRTMLHSLNALTGASIIATDGEMGSVCNFLFDDQTWTVRYLVVETGGWLARRRVLIAVTAIDQPDWVNKCFHAHLTREQVRNSPDVDTEKPVSRQQEIAMSEYFGWPTYWAGVYFPAVPHREYPVHTEEDPHLRSANDVAGYEVEATDGDVGRVDDFIIDNANWHLSYLVVRTGDWLNCSQLLASTNWVASISWGDRRISLNNARDKV